jgi:DNA-binding response OmpR family regulator
MFGHPEKGQQCDRKGCGGLRLLVVEDEANLADALADGLRADGYGVDIARNGLDGLWRATEYSYDAILLDILLPQLSGYEVLKRIRAANVWSPVLMLTAKDGEYDEADALDLGADDYLTKPFSYVVVRAHVRALLRRGGPSRPAILTAGDLSLDPATHHCARAGTEISLTARETAVLQYLLRRSGEVVSKQDLLEHVWDAHFAGDPNIVEVYVLRLRRKIDTPFGRSSLQTVRGAGYRLTGALSP